jgi:hormone-sensitive lipase
VLVPVFSVDYRLAPKNAYPDPINDCYQAYVWIVLQAKEQLGMQLEHIILAGDSAGGHLCVTVAMLAALRGFKRPDGIFAHYPVFCIDENRFFPSVLMSVDEELLSSAFLEFALSCFTRKGGKKDSNPLLSPIYAPDALLKLLPRVMLMPCEVDPLRDQAFLFAHRLLQAGGRCKIYLMKDHVHGFNNIDQNYFGVNEFKRSTQLTESLFREMFLTIVRSKYRLHDDLDEFEIVEDEKAE